MSKSDSRSAPPHLTTNDGLVAETDSTPEWTVVPGENLEICIKIAIVQQKERRIEHCNELTRGF